MTEDDQGGGDAPPPPTSFPPPGASTPPPPGHPAPPSPGAAAPPPTGAPAEPPGAPQPWQDPSFGRPVEPPPVAGYPMHPPHPGYQGYGGWTAYQPPRNDGLAIAGMICGIVGIPTAFFCCIGIVPAVLGIVFGLVARKRIAASNGMLTGAGQALAGIICGIVGIVMFVLYLVLFFSLQIGTSS